MNRSDNYQRKSYHVGIYCRLSKDDGENIISNSIENQKKIVMKYVIENGWDLYDIYMDDGYTGTHFDRPGFKRLLKDIEQKNVSMVITKDMSRLGRDYIQVGYYIEKYFPEQGVRYVALNDHIDTGEEIDDIAPFKAIINDMYSKDISKKIKSVLDMKRQEGKFIGSFAPYGYKKDIENKGHLVIDHRTAPIVKRIFHMYLGGKGLKMIANQLNEEGIPSPSIYKSQNIKTYHHGTMKIPKWCHSAVKHILTNTTYTGDLAQGKAKKINYKSEKIKRLKRDDWIIIENTHEPIISKEEFNLVQKLMNQKNKNYGGSKKSLKLFSGFAFCGDCGHHMTYHKMPKGYCFLICSTYKKYGKKECSRHPILEEELEEMILEDIKKIINQFVNRENLEKMIKKIVEDQEKIKKSHQGQLTLIEKRLEEIKGILKSLYEDRARGIIEEKQLLEFYLEFNHEKHNLLERKKKLEKPKENRDDRIKKLIEDILKPKKLNRLILIEFVEKIEILGDGDIRIYYKIKP